MSDGIIVVAGHRYVVMGVWCMVCGVWCVVCGVWCVVFRLFCVLCEVRGRPRVVRFLPENIFLQLSDTTFAQCSTRYLLCLVFPTY